MNKNKSRSLSLQREIESREILIETEMDRSLQELNVKTMLRQGGITKKRGYGAGELFYLILLLPFLKQCIAYLTRRFEAEKDSYYRFLNQERFNWRRFVYLLALRIIAQNQDIPLRQKVLIADDTITPKTGEKIEMVSYHYDHKTSKTVLGNQLLQLGYHVGLSYYPLDMAVHTSNNRPNLVMRDIDKRTNGWKRRMEALRKKTDVLVEMLSRAWQNGIDASFVLFDSWFSYDKVISQILEVGYGVICRLKDGNVKYEYRGAMYTLKQLWQKVGRKQIGWLGKYRVKGAHLTVRLPKSGEVQIVYIAENSGSFQAFLCTDVELEAHQVLEYYARRWAIEVFFKDAKQLFKLGKEQSNTFDAVVASFSLVMVRHLLLTYILNKYREGRGIDPLFRGLSEEHLQVCLMEEIWIRMKEIFILSMALVFEALDGEKIVELFDIIEGSLDSPL